MAFEILELYIFYGNNCKLTDKMTPADYWELAIIESFWAWYKKLSSEDSFSYFKLKPQGDLQQN